MKEIDYNFRAKWDESISEDTGFIETILKNLNIDCILEIPCGNGRNLNLICSNVKYAYFGDINTNMIDAIKKKIIAQGITNGYAMILDLCDLSLFHFTHRLDLILIPQQSFQILNRKQAVKALKSIKATNVKYIILDVYDFLSNASDKPYYLKCCTHFFDGAIRWIRESSFTINSETRILLHHNYIKENQDIFDKKYMTDIILENYSRKDLIKLCIEIGFTVLDVFTSYNLLYDENDGRTLLILMNT